MKMGDKVIGETKLQYSLAISKRCNRAAVGIKREDLNPTGTAKDRRNAPLLEEHLHLKPLVIVQITSGNSGYSTGMLAKMIDPEEDIRKRKIIVINIVAENINPKIEEKLRSCSIVHKENLTLANMGEEWRKELAKVKLKREFGIDVPDENIVEVDCRGDGNHYQTIGEELIKYMKGGEGGTKDRVPTHVFVPLGAGELLLGIRKKLFDEYGDRCPKIIGVTVPGNLFAPPATKEEVSVLADKLLAGVSGYEKEIRDLIASGGIEIRVVNDERIREEYKYINENNIPVEFSSVVAFCAAFDYGLKKGDRAIIIDSGKGIFDEGMLEEKERPEPLKTGYEAKIEDAAYYEDNPAEARLLLGRDLLLALKNGDIDRFDSLMAIRRLKPERISLEEVDENGNTPICIAAANGNLGAVRELINAGANGKHPNRNRNAPLNLACENGQVEIAAVLLLAGAEIDGRNSNGESPLSIAVRKKNGGAIWMLFNFDEYVESRNLAKGMEKVGGLQKGIGPSKVSINEALRVSLNISYNESVRYLLEHGANDDCVYTNNRYTPLMIAAEQGNIEILEMFLDRIPHGLQDSRINYQNQEWNSAITLAARSGKVKAVEMLLDYGAEVDNFNNIGDTALILAAADGHTEIVELLLKNDADIEHSNSCGNTALMVAAMYGNTETIKLLLENKAKIDHQNHYGYTALMNASMGGHIGAVQILLEKGADMELTTKQGQTVLVLCFFYNQPKIKDLLVAKGANMEDSKGKILLHAAQFNQEARVRTALELGADIEYEDRRKEYAGDTAFITAAIYGNETIANLLIEHGADVLHCNKDGEDALFWARENDHYGIVEAIVTAILEDEKTWNRWVERCGDVEKAKGRLLIECAYCDIEKPLVRLLNGGANVEYEDEAITKDKDTALIIAGWRGNDRIAEILFEHGADIFHLNNKNNSAFFWAEKNENAETVKVMLAEIVNNQKTFDKFVERGGNAEKARGALLIGCARWGDGESLLKLLSAGANAGSEDGIRDDDKNDALIEAAGRGNKRAVEILIEHGADVLYRNKKRGDAFLRATKNNHGETVKVILAAILNNEKTWNVWVERSGNVCRAKGRVLALSAHHGAEELVEKLFDMGADSQPENEISDYDKNQALLLAAESGNMRIMEILIERGADILYEDEKLKSPIYWARKNKHAQIIKLIESEIEKRNKE